MRQNFWGHYPLSNQEQIELWGEATIILDTNSLLNLYRYSLYARNDLLKVLRHFQPRLWIPYQVAEEFHRNRVERIREQLRFGSNISDTLKASLEQASSDLGKYTKNAFVDVAEIQSSLKKHFESVISEVSDRHNRGLTKYGISPQNDPILEQVAILYENGVGQPYNQEKLEELTKEGARRYESKIPPGYKDSSKPEDRRYGDFILWSQIIEYAKTNERHVIFVTDDNKEDWWWRSSGETLGPRPEIRTEFLQETRRMLYMYQPANFLKQSEDRFQIGISSTVVKEVLDTSAKQAELEEQRDKSASRDFIRFRNGDRHIYVDASDEPTEAVTLGDRIINLQGMLKKSRRNREKAAEMVAYLESKLDDASLSVVEQRRVIKSIEMSREAYESARNSTIELQEELEQLQAVQRLIIDTLGRPSSRKRLSGSWLRATKTALTAEDVIGNQDDEVSSE